MGDVAGAGSEPADREVAEQTTSSEIDEARTDAPFDATGSGAADEAGAGGLGGEVLEPHELGQYGDPYQTDDAGRTT